MNNQPEFCTLIAEIIPFKNMSSTNSIYKTTTGPKFLIHLFVVLIVFLFPVLMVYDKEFFSWHRSISMLVPQVFAIILFYVNYLYLVEEYLFHKRVQSFFLINTLLLLVSLVLVHLIQDALQDVFSLFRELEEDPRRPGGGKLKGFIIVRHVISLILTAGLSVAIKMTDRLYKTETARKDLEKAHLESELSNLKNQLNPHFLFNTLNNIYSLVAIDQKRAQEAIHQLSRLMRYLLYESDNQMVPLNQDITFLQNYINLMKLRLPEHVETDIQIPDLAFNIQISPLLFIAFAENSFKHGVSAKEDSFIQIKMQLEGKNLVFITENSLHPKSSDDQSGSGVGLKNVQKRLKLLYPDKHNLVIEERRESFYTKLSIEI